MKKNFICQCFLTKNIFLKKYNLHVEYVSDNEFWETYGEILEGRGCVGEEREAVRKEISDEINRRTSNGEQSRLRKELIQEKYKPLHPNVYYLQESYLHPDFKKVVEYSKDNTASIDELLKMIRVCKGERVYALPVFTADFCKIFLEEIKHFQVSDMPKGRPNSMNNSGTLLAELGFNPNFIDKLRIEYLMPIASLLYPDWVGDSGLDSHRAFIVSYNYDKDKDTGLNMHFDNAEVTLNVSLNEGFEDGDLFMAGMRTEAATLTRLIHEPTYGIFHRGQQSHGAVSLESGERHNLIIWMRSSSIRNKLCPRCDSRPVLVETAGQCDGFTYGD